MFRYLAAKNPVGTSYYGAERGKLHTADPQRKKSELVDQLVTLLTEAAEGRLEDKALATLINAWIPANFRDVQRVEAVLKQLQQFSWNRLRNGSLF